MLHSMLHPLRANELARIKGMEQMLPLAETV